MKSTKWDIRLRMIPLGRSERMSHSRNKIRLPTKNNVGIVYQYLRIHALLIAF